MSKLIITAALTGVLATREQCPAIPYTPKEIGEEAERLPAAIARCSLSQAVGFLRSLRS